MNGSVAVVGAGAIGSWLADAFAQARWSVSMLARGATLSALRETGLRVERNGEVRTTQPRIGSAPELGVHELVLLAVKAHALPALAPHLGALIGPETVVISAGNGIPWWFFRDFAGPLRDVVLRSVDPERTQQQAFPGPRTLGSVVHASAHVLAPAQVKVVAADRFILGEPAGGVTDRVLQIVAALREGGVNAQASDRIRHELWAKLWGNMNMNPLSALTRSGTLRMLADSDVRGLCVRMMEEMELCADQLGLRGEMTPAQRIDVTLRLGDFKTSMLQDLEAGRRLELAPQLGAVVEIAGLLNSPAPFMRAVLGMTRLLDP